MATEVLYADTLFSGSIVNSGNALGSTTGTWAGELNTNSSHTDIWTIADPTDPNFVASSTISVEVMAKKGSNANSPSLQVNIYDGGTLVKTGTNTTITSTTGQTVTETDSEANYSSPANLRVETIMTAAGGSPSNRNSAQIDYIKVTVDTEAGPSSTIYLADALVTTAYLGDTQVTSIYLGDVQLL